MAVATGDYTWTCSGACAAAGLTLCYGKCVDTAVDPMTCGECATACTRDRWCYGASCIWRYPLTRCGGGGGLTCKDLRIDPNNCGACNVVC